MTTAIVAATAPPPRAPFRHRRRSPRSSNPPSIFTAPTPLLARCSRLTLQCSSSFSSSSTSVVEEQEEEGSSLSPTASEVGMVDSKCEDDDTDAVPLSGCKACGREQLEQGCNGEGRIQGGIATIPGFGWWPIKAYRPCPGFVASGGRYRRAGQSMDEVAFGGGKGGSSTGAFDEDGTRKKRKDRRRFKG